MASKEYQQQWKKAHPEQVKAQARKDQRQYIKNHILSEKEREHKRINARKWREQNPERAKQSNREAQRRWKEIHPEVAKTYHRTHTLKKKHGITPEILNAMLVNQNNLCAICFRPLLANRGTHVDHDHITGALRGLLCPHCNQGLGHFRDDEKALSRAIEYLRWYKSLNNS